MKNFIKNYKTKGMVGVSSKYLVRKMLGEVDFSKDQIIVQLWVWTGVFTREILKNMSKNSKLYAFEVDTNCKKHIENIHDERFSYIEDSAEFLEKYVKQPVHTIISTLPFASLPNTLLPTIINECKDILAPNGIFLQYQYFLTDKKRIENIFQKKATLGFELRNFPPAFIYKIQV